MPGSPHFHLMNGLIAQQAQGMAVVYRMVQQQASLLAYNDIYRTLALAAAIFCAGLFAAQAAASGRRACPLNKLFARFARF